MRHEYPMSQQDFDNFKKNMTALTNVTLMQVNNSSGIVKTAEVQADYFYNATENKLVFSGIHVINQSVAENSGKEVFDKMLEDASLRVTPFVEDATLEEAGSGSERWYGDGSAWTDNTDGTNYPAGADGSAHVDNGEVKVPTQQ